MTVCIPFCQKDRHAARRLLEWVKWLGGVKQHACLLVADAATEFSDVISLNQLAETIFGSVEFTSPDKSVSGWPIGPNSLFYHAAEKLRGSDQPFLWLEPDAIPISAGWLDAIEAEYVRSGKPFMGCVISVVGQPQYPPKYLAGCAVYPPNAHELIGVCKADKRAWDIASTGTVLPLAAETKLIQHFWGQAGLPPTFSERRLPGSPVNTFTLKNIKPETVLFHRCKDGTLMRLLSNGNPNPPKTPTQFVVVVHFSITDTPLAVKNLKWMKKLHGKTRFDCVLSHESNLGGIWVQQMVALSKELFQNVEVFRYGRSPLRGWPGAPNWAFQQTARRMDNLTSKSWLWLEADAVPVKIDWLEQLNDEYADGGMPLMGTIVPNMGHMNGVGIYPSYFCQMSPYAMTAREQAWDYKMLPDTKDVTHDASHLIQHFWGVHQGQPHYSQGPAPHFDSLELVKQWVKPATVLFHRCKDGSLIDFYGGEKL